MAAGLTRHPHNPTKLPKLPGGGVRACEARRSWHHKGDAGTRPTGTLTSLTNGSTACAGTLPQTQPLLVQQHHELPLAVQRVPQILNGDFENLHDGRKLAEPPGVAVGVFESGPHAINHRDNQAMPPQHMQ